MICKDVNQNVGEEHMAQLQAHETDQENYKAVKARKGPKIRRTQLISFHLHLVLPLQKEDLHLVT